MNAAWYHNNWQKGLEKYTPASKGKASLFLKQEGFWHICCITGLESHSEMEQKQFLKNLTSQPFQIFSSLCLCSFCLYFALLMLKYQHLVPSEGIEEMYKYFCGGWQLWPFASDDLCSLIYYCCNLSMINNKICFFLLKDSLQSILGY